MMTITTLIPKEDIIKIRENLNNISLNYYRNNINKIYKIHEGQQEIAELLNKYELYYLFNIDTKQSDAVYAINNYLKECEIINDILDLINKYNWSLEDFEKYFGRTKAHIKSIINRKTKDLEQQIKNLYSKNIKDLTK